MIRPSGDENPSSDELTPEGAYRTMRRLWVGLLVWHAVLLGLALGLARGQPVLDWPGVAVGLLVGSSALVLPGLGVVWGVAGYLRMQSYKRYWEGAAVTPKGYVLGNLWVFGALDFSATLSAAAVLCSGDPRFAIPGVVAMTLEGINRPSRGPMEAQRRGGPGGGG